MKSKPIMSLFQTMKIRLLDFYCLGLFFSLQFYEGLKVVYLSEITAIEPLTSLIVLTLRLFCTLRQADCH